ncbi:MAG: TIGR04438 family Trp-rich protein [Rubrivivax sp.]
MWFLVVGVLLLVMKIAEVGPVADWSWVVILAPFGLAVTWWAIADSTGMTQRRAIQRMEDRKRERRERDMKALGLDVRRDRRIRVLKESSRKGAPPAPPPSHSRRDPKL